MKERITNKLIAIRNKAVTFVHKMRMEVTGIAIAAGTTSYAYAGGKDEVTSKITKILDIIIGLFPAIGIILVAVGGFKLFMAFRNNQPDQYSDAGKEIVIGIALAAFDTFLWGELKKMV